MKKKGFLTKCIAGAVLIAGVAALVQHGRDELRTDTHVCYLDEGSLYTWAPGGEASEVDKVGQLPSDFDAEKDGFFSDNGKWFYYFSDVEERESDQEDADSDASEEEQAGSYIGTLMRLPLSSGSDASASSGGPAWLRRLSGSDASDDRPEMISTHILTDSVVTSDDDKVVYRKDDGGLYLYQDQDEQKLADDIDGFACDINRTYLVYSQEKKDSLSIYRQDLTDPGRESQLIEDKIDKIFFLYPTFYVFGRQTSDTYPDQPLYDLYTGSAEDGSRKIDDKVAMVSYPNQVLKEFYYTKAVETETPLLDFVNTDDKDSYSLGSADDLISDLRDNKVQLRSFELLRYENSFVKKLDDNLTGDLKPGAPTGMVYETFDHLDKKCMDIVQLPSADAARQALHADNDGNICVFADQKIDPDSDYGLLADGKPKELDTDHRVIDASVDSGKHNLVLKESENEDPDQDYSGTSYILELLSQDTKAGADPVDDSGSGSSESVSPESTASGSGEGVTSASGSGGSESESPESTASDSDGSSVKGSDESVISGSGARTPAADWEENRRRLGGRLNISDDGDLLRVDRNGLYFEEDGNFYIQPYRDKKIKLGENIQSATVYNKKVLTASADGISLYEDFGRGKVVSWTDDQSDRASLLKDGNLIGLGGEGLIYYPKGEKQESTVISEHADYYWTDTEEEHASIK